MASLSPQIADLQYWHSLCYNLAVRTACGLGIFNAGEAPFSCAEFCRTKPPKTAPCTLQKHAESGMIRTKKGIERIACTMKSFEYVSLIAVALLVLETVRLFNLNGSYAKGPLNPYAFFYRRDEISVGNRVRKGPKRRIIRGGREGIDGKIQRAPLHRVQRQACFMANSILSHLQLCGICVLACTTV